MLISVWLKKIKNKQASRSVKPMLLRICVMTRTVKLICSQWSQQWICSQLNHQVTSCVLTRTVNLPDVTRKSIQWDQNAMTRTVNLLEVRRKSPMRPVCHDKYQSARCAHMQKSAMPQSIYKKVKHCTELYRRQVVIQLEITRNCQDSTNKHWYPSVIQYMCPDTVKIQTNHLWPGKLELKMSQVNTSLQQLNKLI